MPERPGEILQGHRPVILVAMPWGELNLPSIQLGTLVPVLRRAGFRAEARTYYLDLMEYYLDETLHLDDDRAILPRDYRAVASAYWSVGLGDWIFTVPPFRPDDPVRDAAYLDYLRNEGVGERFIARVVQMRSLSAGFLSRCADDLLAAKPSVVGFTSSFSQNVAALALARALKDRDPSVRVAFGGANCEGPMGAALLRSFPWVDVVVRGEAERVLPDVVEDLLSGSEVRPLPGVVARRGDGGIVIGQGAAAPVSMDEVPLPDYDEYFDRLSRSRVRALIGPRVKLLIEGSRGCWWGERTHCTFCGLNGSMMTFRSKSPMRLVDEVRALSARYRRLEFEAVDNILDLAYLKTFVPAVRDARRSGFDFRFFFETKANLTKNDLRQLRDAGIRRIQPGLESLSTPILRAMGKGVNAVQNIRLLKWAGQFGIQATWNIIYGFPGEDPHDYERMARLIPALGHLKPPSLVRLRVQRFSPYHDRPGEHGLELVGPAPYYRFLYDVDEPTLVDLAYEFEHKYRDGRDPETYVAPLRRAIERWEAEYHDGGMNSLRAAYGPGFLVITDQRPGLEPREFTFGEVEASIYSCCDAGASTATIQANLQRRLALDIDRDTVTSFLDEQVERQLVYEEGGRYLSLAVPTDPDVDCPAPSADSATGARAIG